jgi:glucokinase
MVCGRPCAACEPKRRALIQLAMANTAPSDAALRVGLDIGGTRLKALVCDAAGDIKARHAMDTDADGGFDSVVGRILALTEEVIGMAGAADLVAGIGMSLAGNLDSTKGICRFSPNLPGWRHVQVARPVIDRFGVPFRMNNDANCAALAEYRFGAGMGATNMALLTLGTGIGGGLIIGGRLMVGPREGMGEIGHTILDPNGPECGCGCHGCLEAFCGAAGIARIARRRLQTGTPSIILDRAKGDILDITPLIISECAKEGDRVAHDVLAEVGNHLGVGITSLAMIVDPDVVVLGGNIADAGEPLFGPIRRTVKARARMVPVDASRIVPAQRGNDAGALGAVALFDEANVAEIV